MIAASLLAGSIAACSSSAEADGETLASFLGWDEDVDEAASEAQWREQEAAIQESIRACMADAGFEYSPVDHTVGAVTVYDETDEEERIRSEGFGITTWYGELGAQNEPDVDEVDEFVDPNAERIEAMSESEQEAFYEALHGSEEEQRENSTVEVDPETGEELGWTMEGFGHGCEGQAHEEVYGASDDEALWEELSPAFEELHERVQADPRIVAQQEEWSSCMAEAGYDYTDANQMHDAVYDDFQARLDEILGPDGGYVDPFDGWSEEQIDAFFEEKTEDEIDAFFQQADQQRDETIDQDALAALQREEIDLAVADLECRDGEEFYALYEEVSASYEADFIAENRETLERLRDAQSD